MMGRRGTSKGARRGPALGVSRGGAVKTAGGLPGQWWSPPWLAAELAEWAGVERGMRVLDAGAGQGALGLAALDLRADVVFVERHMPLAVRLDDEFSMRARVVAADFLERDTRTPTLFDADCMRGFDVCLTNPPWEGDLPEQFLIRACELARRCCAIVPLNLLCGGKRSAFWRGAPIVPTRAKALARRPKFLGARGGMRDVMLLEVEPRSSRWSGPRSFPIEVGDA